MTSNEARIIKVIAEYYGKSIADVTLDTVLQSLTDHKIDALEIVEIVFEIEEALDVDVKDAAIPKPDGVTVRDFLRMVEPEGAGS